MGSTLMGTQSKLGESANLMTPEQSQFLSQLLGQNTGNAQGALGSLLQPYSEDFFQKSVIDPSMRTYQQQTLPSIGQQFGDANASSSSALNQALARSAQDLAGSLAGQRLSLQQNQAQQNLGGLNLLGGLAGQRTFEPTMQQGQQGILGPLLGAIGSLGGAALGAPTGSILGSLMGPNGQKKQPLTAG